MIKGTTIGTITDIDGFYSIEATPDQSLVFSYVGYDLREVAVGDQKNISVVMELDSKTLDEIVVIGYGTSKKSHLTGVSVT